MSSSFLRNSGRHRMLRRFATIFSLGIVGVTLHTTLMPKIRNADTMKSSVNGMRHSDVIGDVASDGSYVHTNEDNTHPNDLMDDSRVQTILHSVNNEMHTKIELNTPAPIKIPTTSAPIVASTSAPIISTPTAAPVAATSTPTGAPTSPPTSTPIVSLTSTPTITPAGGLAVNSTSGLTGASIVSPTDDVIDENPVPPTTSTSNDKTKTSIELKSLLLNARAQYDTIIKEEYGKYGDAIFGRSSVFEHITSQSSLSSERLKRRMKIKIIQAQLMSESIDDSVTFTWVVGGNSVAAGHGNLLRQSYAAVLEAAVNPFFAALGIQFYGKNYASSAMPSGPEASMCMNSLYGMDLDVLSWDFGLTDGRNTYSYELWAQRAGVHPTKPSLFMIGGSFHKNIELPGMASFKVTGVEPNEIPDSNFDDGDPMDIPSGLRYYKCDGHLETGDTCVENKYNTSEFCPTGTINYQVTWHPGWKLNQIVGHQLASYMVENLFDALTELDASLSSGGVEVDNVGSNKSIVEANEESEKEDLVPSINGEYLEYLLSLELKDKEEFLASEIPQNNVPLAKIGPEAYNQFHRANAVCHTSLIPSFSRYEGLVTEEKQNITYMYAGKTSYTDEGFALNASASGYASDSLPDPQPENNETTPTLCAHQDLRRINNGIMKCNHSNYDFRDSFVLRSKDNWMSMTVPNDSEREVFSLGDKSRPILGLIMICSNWIKRKVYDDVKIPELINATLSAGIVVNGVNVVEVTEVDPRCLCHVLKHAGGYYFPEITRGDDTVMYTGQFDIKIRVPMDGGTLYLSSITVL